MTMIAGLRKSPSQYYAMMREARHSASLEAFLLSCIETQEVLIPPMQPNRSDCVLLTMARISIRWHAHIVAAIQPQQERRIRHNGC
jgi:hypothetical protein